MSWNDPSGSVRLIANGNTFSLSSTTAISIGSTAESGSGASIGAPSESCRDLAPTILALSKRVSFGGPINAFFTKLIILSTNPVMLPDLKLNL